MTIVARMCVWESLLATGIPAAFAVIAVTSLVACEDKKPVDPIPPSAVAPGAVAAATAATPLAPVAPPAQLATAEPPSDGHHPQVHPTRAADGGVDPSGAALIPGYVAAAAAAASAAGMAVPSTFPTNLAIPRSIPIPSSLPTIPGMPQSLPGFPGRDAGR